MLKSFRTSFSKATLVTLLAGVALFFGRIEFGYQALPLSS
jgi:hypothetical protein